MKRYVFSPEARKDINELWEFIAQDSIDGHRPLGGLDGLIHPAGIE